MIANRIHFSLLIVVLIGALASCYKAPEFINPVYSCECGSVTFRDSLYNLKMAEAVVPDSLEPLSRSYHIVADLRTPEEVDAHVPAHDLTFHFSFPVLDALMYDIQQEDIQYLVQVIKHVDNLPTIQDYIATAGTIEIDAASNGGEETVEFNLSIRESVDSILVGEPVAFTGIFTDIIE